MADSYGSYREFCQRVGVVPMPELIWCAEFGYSTTYTSGMIGAATKMAFAIADADARPSEIRKRQARQNPATQKFQCDQQ